jgi:hypothetical protein
MKLKVVSDGTPMGTRVEDEHGNVVENVVNVLWSCNADDGHADVSINLVRLPVEVVGQVAHVTADAPGWLLAEALDGMSDEELAEVQKAVQSARVQRQIKRQIEVTTMEQAANGEREFVDAE